MGVGTESIVATPAPAATAGTTPLLARFVTSGNSTSHYITSSGALWGMGQNDASQLGNPSITPGSGRTSTPVPVVNAEGAPITGVRTVATVDAYSLFAKIDGSLWGMGTLPLGSNAPGNFRFTSHWAVPISDQTDVSGIGMGPVIDIAVASRTAFLLSATGDLYLVGFLANDPGQPASGHSFPHKIAEGVAAVSTGVYQVLFLKTDGSLWTMGRNNGRLGDGTNEDRYDTPVPVILNVGTEESPTMQPVLDAVAASAGSRHNFFVRADGSLWGTGSGSVISSLYGTSGTAQLYAQPLTLGDEARTPVTQVKNVSGGGASDSLLWLHQDRTVWAAGAGNVGQLGIANIVDGIAITQEIVDVAEQIKSYQNEAYQPFGGVMAIPAFTFLNSFVLKTPSP